MIKILKYSEVDKSTLFLRDESVTRVGATVAEIIENVRRNGDRALLDYALHFDKVSLSSLEVTQSELKDACEPGISRAFGDTGARGGKYPCLS